MPGRLVMRHDGVIDQAKSIPHRLGTIHASHGVDIVDALRAFESPLEHDHARAVSRVNDQVMCDRVTDEGVEPGARKEVAQYESVPAAHPQELAVGDLARQRGWVVDMFAKVEFRCRKAERAELGDLALDALASTRLIRIRIDR